MRKISLAFLFSSCFVALAYGQAATYSETNVSRPGGAYTNSPAPSASACASLCAGDSLCMAWDYAVATQVCELKAVTPAPRQASGFVSGLSARAPAFARAMSVPTPQAPPPSLVLAAAPTSTASSDPAPARSPPLSPSAPPTENEALLGGPETASEAAPSDDLRARTSP
jgi:hypothetical protein